MLAKRFNLCLTHLIFLWITTDAQMKDLFNCFDHFQTKNATEIVPNHANLCFMLTRCTEHVIRYQTDYATALEQNISCCRAFNATFYQRNASNCQIDCNIKCHQIQCQFHRKLQSDRGCRCDPGYIYDPRSDQCVPKCSKSCRASQGVCTTPNKCQCPAGFILDSQDVCTKSNLSLNLIKPNCSQNCNNGYCNLNNTCVCFENYTFSDDRTTCRPICREECINGECVQPDVCVCNNPEFRLSETNPFVCESVVPSTTTLVRKSSPPLSPSRLLVLVSICALVASVVVGSCETYLFDKCLKKSKKHLQNIDLEVNKRKPGGQFIRWYGNVGYLTSNESEFFV